MFDGARCSRAVLHRSDAASGPAARYSSCVPNSANIRPTPHSSSNRRRGVLRLQGARRGRQAGRCGDRDRRTQPCHCRAVRQHRQEDRTQKRLECDMVQTGAAPIEPPRRQSGAHIAPAVPTRRHRDEGGEECHVRRKHGVEPRWQQAGQDKQETGETALIQTPARHDAMHASSAADGEGQRHHDTWQRQPHGVRQIQSVPVMQPNAGDDKRRNQRNRGEKQDRRRQSRNGTGGRGPGRSATTAEPSPGNRSCERTARSSRPSCMTASPRASISGSCPPVSGITAATEAATSANAIRR